MTIKIDLLSDRPLGTYPPQDGVHTWEYQVGIRLIWISFREPDDVTSRLLALGDAVQEVWNDIDNVVAFAEAQSRSFMPNFWRQHDESKIPGRRFDVWGLRFSPDSDCVTYDIGCNWDFRVDGLPDLPDDTFMTITGHGPGRYALTYIDASNLDD
jgi:hypothetical protein